MCSKVNLSSVHETNWYTTMWGLRDKRVDDWPLMNSPAPTIFFIAFYVLFAVKLGPMYMKNKKSFNIRKLLVVFNIIMLCYNAYIVQQFWILAWGNDYSWKCQPLDRSLSERSLKIANLVWLYYICKFMDWFDTLFFVMRKKFDHISPLHVYHHMIMPSFGWFSLRFMPGGHPTFIGLVNCSVHVVMHFYYCIAALGPQYQKYLWWKKYLTILQLVQFVICILHAIQALFLYECGIDVPLEWGYFFAVQAVLFIILFANFYRKTYTKKLPCSVPVELKTKLS